jgi:hypothetical protein
MRKKHPYVFAVIVISFISLVSCNKTPNPAIIIPTDSTSGTLLTAAIGFDTLHTSGQDTTDKTLLTYDNVKRVHSIAFFVYDSLGFFSEEVTTTYTYTGSSIYPSSSTSYDISNGISNSTYTFDNTGNLLYEKDVQPNLTDSTVTLYYISGAIYNTSIYYSYGGSIRLMDTVYYQQTLTGTAAVFATNYGSFGDNVFNFTNITYDTHKNPFTNIKFVLMNGSSNSGDGQSGYYGKSGYFGGWAFSANNITSYQDTYTDPSGSTPETYNTSSFIYNTNDYPVSCRYNSTGVADPYKAGKELFYYTN